MAGRDHLIRIVQRILDLEGTEEEIDELIAEFCEAVPHPQALDVLGKHDSASAIVNEALSYKPIEMPATWAPGEND